VHQIGVQLPATVGPSSWQRSERLDLPAYLGDYLRLERSLMHAKRLFSSKGVSGPIAPGVRARTRGLAAGRDP
jgi:hypothetical protein